MIANILVAIVALIHVFIVILEMLLWEKPIGLKVFKNTPESARATRALGANQGLYNGFLVAGLVWGLAEGVDGFDIKLFFLACVSVAGVFGAVTFSPKTLLVQSLFAGLGLVALFLGV